MSPQTKTTVTVAASASLAMLALLVALPFYVLAIIQVSQPHTAPIAKPAFESVPTAVDVPRFEQYPDMFVNPDARDEVKGQIGDCPTCPQQPTTQIWRRQNRWFSPQPQRPVVIPASQNWTTPIKPVAPATAKPAQRVSKLDEKKTGAWCCAKCKRLVTGSDMETYWTEDSFGNPIPITFMCASCAVASTANEREAVMKAWLEGQGVKLNESAMRNYIQAVR